MTDFGLARRVEGGDDLTRSGVIVGSPPYMAPEQAAGDRRAVTTATDVYGLGAVLYWLLTGRPPFQGETAIEILDQVRGQAPEPPATLNSRVDRDLQTICLKCLEKDPPRRYASAEALADDLDRWLAGEPIAARPVGPTERARRWCRRNPVVAGLAASILVLLAAGLIGTVVGFVAIERQRAEAVRQRDQARIQREQARKAVDEMYTQVAEKWMGHEAGLKPLQKEFLQKALNYYLDFAGQQESDLATRLATAAAFRQVGAIQAALGESPAAAYDKAIAVYTEIIRLDSKRAEANNGRGMVWGYRRNHQKAIADYTEAIRLDPNSSSPYLNRGSARRESHEYDQGIADFTAGIRLVPKFADAYVGRGILHYRKNDYGSAIADYTEAMRLDPKLPRAYHERGNAWRARKDFSRAIADYTEAIRLDPNLTEPYVNRGIAWRTRKDYARALADFNEAIRLDPKQTRAYLTRGVAWREQKEFAKAIADFNENIRLDPGSSIAYVNRGIAWRGRKDYARAIADCTEAIRLDPKSTEAYLHRGIASRKTDDIPKAIADLDEAVRLAPKSAAAYRRGERPGAPRAVTTRPSPTTLKPSGSSRNRPRRT